MQSIRDIIDTALSVGFNYFYGLGDDKGYLRRMLQSGPSLEAVYAQLKDDIQFISAADEDYFKTPQQLNNFKKLKKYIKEAKKYVAGQLKKKKKGSKWEQRQIEKEIRSLDKELREGLIEKEEYDYAVRTLLRPGAYDIEEVKSKFEEIDMKAKQELKKVGFKDENLEFDEEDDIVYDIEANESKQYDINKLVDEDNRRYTMEEFNDLYEDIAMQQTALKNKVTNDPLTKKNNVDALRIRNNRIRNLIAKKKVPNNMNRAQLDKLTDEQLAGLENT